MLVDLYTKEGTINGKVELPDDIFAIVPNEHAMHQDVITYLAHQRQGTHKTKVRNEVSGGGKKPWRQKGRGTARAGSTRSPLWVGGGTIHGPKPHTYDLKLPKKVKKLARKSALSARCSENNIFVIEDFQIEEAKTKNVYQILKNLNLENDKALMLIPDKDDTLLLSARNIEKLTLSIADKISTYDILNHKRILIFKSAIDLLSKTLSN